MESPWRWTTFYCFIYLLIPDASIFCQNVPSELVSKQTFTSAPVIDKEIKREFSNIASKPSSKAQFMNTLLSLASNGAVPDRTGPVIPTPIPENPFTSNIINEIPRTVNIMPIQPQIPSYVRESANFNGQPSIINPAPNMLFTPPLPPTSYVPVRNIQTAVTPEPISLNTYLTVPQVIPLQSYGNTIQTSPTVWQIPQPFNDGCSYVPAKPVSYTEITPPPVNLQISPPSPILPEINTNCGIIEFLSAPNVATVVQEPTNLISDYDSDGFPLNLQINLPSQNMPAPRITVVSASPQPVAEVKKEPDYGPFLPFGGFPPPPPFIMRKSRSSWRKILPIILLALFNDGGCYCGGCCSCNCGCSCDSDNPIPIPYPIPIPINNPIINNSKSSSSSRKRGQRGNGGEKGTK